MAARKPLFMGTEGFSEEMAISDAMTLGGLTMGGNVVMATNKITGLGAGSASGDALAYGQASANLADLTIASAGDITLSGGGEVLGLPSVPTVADSAASKAYVDSLVTGLGWKEAVACFRLIGNRTVTQVNALSPVAGDAYVVTDAGTLTAGSLAVVAGDLVEFNCTGWLKLVAASGGFVPAGTRAILSDTDTLLAPYTDGTDNDKIVVFSGSSNTGADTGDTVDKASVLIQDPGHVGYYDNLGYVYEGTPATGTWIQFTGAGTINAGDGLSKTGNTLDVDLATNSGLHFTSTQLEAFLNGTTLQKGAAGLSVKGLPSLFEVNAVAVSANVTAANLTELTGGGATTLHTHDYSPTGHTHTHASTTGQTANDHHNQSHVLDGGDHTVSGLTPGHILTALTASTFGFAAPVSTAGEASRVENTLTTATDATADGDPVYVNGNSTVGKARADNDAKSRVIGVIRTGSGAAGATPEVVTVGICAGVLSGASAGATYYLGSTGGLSAALPGAANRVIALGYAYNATDLWVGIRDYGKKAA